MLYDLPIVGHLLLKIMTNLQGGECRSISLRKYCLQRFNVKVDKFTYGGCFKKGFNTGGYVEIGRYCSIANDVHYFGANHPLDALSTSAIFYNKKLFGLKVVDVERNAVKIGNDVWIGHGVIITAACHNIGNGAVIGAGTIVTKDVPAYAIVVGNPGKIIKYRFDTVTIEKLLKLEYWNLSPQELMKYYNDFGDIPALLNLMNKK